MTCPKCRRQVPMDNAKFCPFCGSSLSAEKKPVRHRRANGTGSVYKRGKTWTASVTDGFDRVPDQRNPSGLRNVQRRRTVGGFATKTEALLFIDKLREDKAKANTKSIEHYWKIYESSAFAQLSESKQRAYRIAYRRLEEISRKPIQNITLAELQKIINGAKTYYPAHEVKILLSRFFRMAAAEGINNTAILDMLVLPKMEKHERQTFSSEDQKKFWECYESGKCTDCAMPLIMIYTGMMPGELLQLKKSMIDFDRKEIRGAGLKTEVRRATSILIPDVLLPVLEDCVNSAESDLLFPIKTTQFKKRYTKALEIAGVDYLTPYCCRHTTATALAVNEKIAPQIVKRVMRWSNTKMMDTYVHPTDDDARQAINTIEKK